MNTRSTTGAGIVGIGLLIAVLHYFASQGFWYWQYWWFDIVMHFLGGLFIALTIYWFLRNEFSGFFLKPGTELLVVFSGVFIVGVLWEIFEYVTGAYSASGYTLDTTLDLIVNISGVLSAFIIYKRL